jgi:hypothetical protein
MRTSSLKQKAPLQRKTPMSRTGFKAPAAGAGLLRVAAAQAKAAFPRNRESKPTKRMKSSRPKMTPIRKSARGQECTLQILGVCNGDSSTVVLCHSNSLADGKGMGLKASDEKACFGCSACHDVLDGRAPRPVGMTKEDVEAAFNYAVERTHEMLRAMGLIPARETSSRDDHENTKEAA